MLGMLSIINTILTIVSPVEVAVCSQLLVLVLACTSTELHCWKFCSWLLRFSHHFLVANSMNLLDAIICAASYELHMHTFSQPGTTFGMTLNLVDWEGRARGGSINQAIRRCANFIIILFSRRISVVVVGHDRIFRIIVDFVHNIGVQR
jgi:hypothetical protein